MIKLNFILPCQLAALFATCHSMASLRQSYSMLQYGHKLERRVIASFDKYSILDCVEDCLRTPRCQSINYYKGANFCQTNFESRTSEPDLYIEKPGWIYSAKEDWDKEIAGVCSMSDCAMNEKCIPKPFGKFECVISDCGMPVDRGFSFDKVEEWDAIGVSRGIHINCLEEFEQNGSDLFICRSDGLWKADLRCTGKKLGCYQDVRDRVLEMGPYTLSKNGKMYCTNLCRRLGQFKYFGLQYGNECFCGNQLRFSPTRLSDSECSKQCTGNVGETCGATWKMEIYRI